MASYTQTVQPVAPVSIGSPRMMLPRSHRLNRSRRSPRQGNSEDQELALGHQARAAANLNIPDNSNTHNVDPGEPYLEPASAETVKDIEAQKARDSAEGADSHHFVGGFVFDRLKRAVQGASIQWGSGSRQAQGVPPTYSPPYAISEVGDPSIHQRYSSSDDTAHYPVAATEEEEGTTAVDYHNMPEPQYAPQSSIITPVNVEPLPADDYRKMKTPSPTLTDQSYFSRFKKFIHDINSLPWVGSDRITVDYYPGQSKRRARPTSGRSQNRSAISMSWYGENYRPPTTVSNMQQVDLTAGESPEMRRVVKPESIPEEQGQMYYTQSGQVWPAVSTVPEHQIPVSPDPGYQHDFDPSSPVPPTPFPQSPIVPVPMTEPAHDSPASTIPQETYYTNDAGQSWPVVSTGHSAPPRSAAYATTPHGSNFYGTHYGPSHA